MEREYIVTARTKEDLESLYNDLETLGGCECIPEREIECVHRRPISRNTHYYLTDEEAELIKNDSRVLNVELNYSDKGLKITPFYNVVSDRWSKSVNNDDAHRPWAKYRCVNGQTVGTTWGSDGTGQNPSVTATVLFTSTGKNVDVVVVDGCFDPTHPEFATNDNGSGASRVNQFNWFSLNPTVTGGAAGTYLYVNSGGGTYINGTVEQQTDNNHGCHVAGTIAGNRRGWAIEANIYNINPYSTAPSPIQSSFLIDYIRAWHRTKAVNTTTGFRNPTITNHSYGITYDIPISALEYVIYRGVQYNTPLTPSQLTGFGLINDGTTILDIPYLSPSAAIDIQDAIADGIIFVGAAGNSSFKIDVAGGQDYDNIVKQTGQTAEYYHRGSSPGAIDNVLCVGNVDATILEQKAISSNCGPRINVYAPGTNVVSSVHNNGGGVDDSRNANYNIIKYNGTSMAAPNVAGVLACIAEQWPRMSQSEVLSYFSTLQLATANQLTSGTGTRSLEGSPNRYLFYPMIRKVPNPSGTTYVGGQTTSQITFPRNNKFRPTSNGVVNQSIYPSQFVYPRHPIWNRRPV